MKRLIIYLLYGTGLLLLIYLGVHHYEELRLTAGRSFDQTPLFRFVAFFAIVFGTELSP
ncbi:MAG: hypothetical protein AAGU75_13050 [Bacillota bacterium]